MPSVFIHAEGSCRRPGLSQRDKNLIALAEPWFAFLVELFGEDYVIITCIPVVNYVIRTFLMNFYYDMHYCIAAIRRGITHVVRSATDAAA